MARRHSRQGGQSRPRRRVAVFSLAALAVLGAMVWMAPTVLVHTSLRDRPLATALAGIDGSITSGSARWGWLSGIEYRDVVLRDRAGRAAIVVPLMVVEQGLLHLAIDPSDLGTLRLVGPQALVEVRGGGSSLEDLLAPWLAASASAGVSCDLELVDGTVEFLDGTRGDAWRITDLIATGSLRAGAGPGSWTVAGRLRHAGRAPGADTRAADEPAGVSAAAVDRLDRATIPAATAAVVVRDGGFSVSSPAADAAGMRTVTLTARRLPLGGSGIVALRWGLDHLADGLADVRLDCDLGPESQRLRGTVAVERFAACRADTLAERFTIDRCEMPLDVEVVADRIAVRTFRAVSPVFRAEASGRIGLPRHGAWQWAESLVDDDFALAVDVDLAAASRALPGGLTVRPDVRITDGRLEVIASSQADGSERVLEVRGAARDLAAVQSAAGPGGAAPSDRLLRWTDPFSAWLRGRRGASGAFVIEESRVASPSFEVSVSGDVRALAIQWTVDLAGLAGELAEVLDTGGLTARGTSRGRIDLAAGTPTAVKVSASATGFELAIPGRPSWKDDDLTIEAEATGSGVAGGAAIDRARVTIKALDDTLEARLEGGALVDVSMAAGGRGRPSAFRIRPGLETEGVSAECAVSGDVARWQSRLGTLALLPADVELAGRLQAALTATPRGDAWQVTRAGVEIEKFAVRCGGRQTLEPRVVASAAGLIHPATGQVDVSAAEILSATLSLRSGGVSWLPASVTAAGGSAGVLDRLRGRLQWQADVGRLEPWLVSAATAARWPATGRAWGTVEIVDGPDGANVLVEATGSQIGIASAAAAGAAARPVWNEPRALVALEVTRPLGPAGPADRLQIDRLAIESSTLAVTAKGGVDGWTTRRLVTLDGTAAYDWAQVSRLLVPFTGGRIQLTGAGGRPFTFRGPFGIEPAATVAVAPAATPLPLPDDWLAAARREAAGSEAAARITVPVVGTDVRDGAASRLRDISIDTSAAWTAATIDGVAIAAGEAAIRLFEGQLAIGPLDVAAAGGRLRGAPWIRLEPWPGELIVPPGRVVDRVTLSGPMCDQVTTWLSPLLGHSTHTSGAVSVDLAGARLPLADPAAGDLTGQVAFDALEVTPTAALAPLVKLLVKLQSLVDPRVAFGDRTVLLRVRSDPIRVRLAGRRLWHEGLVMDAGQFTVKSAGSVGDDGTLAMEVEVALRGDLVGTTPVLAQLVRTPLVIPLTGTVRRPQFDARAIDLMLARIVENTAQAVINDGIGRGLEAILGGPQPPPAPPPPPGR